VKRALPQARVGGPTSTGPGSADAAKFLRDFLEHCVRGKNYATGATGSPIDYITFHAKGRPKFVNGHVQMGSEFQMRDIDRGFEIVASFPELKKLPIIIGESDPEGCAACSVRYNPQNDYRNGTMYSSYTAAVFARKHMLAAKHGVNLDGALTWAFEFEDQPYFAGFRALATNGIDLPVLDVFRMFAKMGGQRVATESSAEVPLDRIVATGVRERPDVAALASVDGSRLAVLVWHYHDDDVAGPDADVKLTIAGLPTTAARLTEYRIDDTHSNAYAVWKRLGSPIAPNDAQYAQLVAASKLAVLRSEEVRTTNGVELGLRLPRQGVSLLVLEWGAAR
jgi:xylan 1,4-beta-xylosidase